MVKLYQNNEDKTTIMSYNIAIMCSGGEASGMNPAIKRFVEYSYSNGFKPYFIFHGLEGLIDGNIKLATHADVEDILNRGGTIIGTSRSKRFMKATYRKIAHQNLKTYDIDRLLVLGGNGSSKAFEVFSSEFKDISFCVLPATIDNDVSGSEYSIGSDTALNIIKKNILNIKDSALSIKRAYVVQTMGRDCGYLAVVSALATGSDLCFIREVEPNFAKLKERIQSKLRSDRNHVIAIVSENYEAGAQKINEWLTNEVGIESRISVLGYIQRGGKPSSYDSFVAYKMVTKALKKLMNDKNTRDIIALKKSNLTFLDITTIDTKVELSSGLLGLAKELN